jgi:hypothetical protein
MPYLPEPEVVVEVLTLLQQSQQVAVAQEP